MTRRRWEKAEMMQPQSDRLTPAEREGRLLLTVAVGLGCLIVLCLALVAVAGGLALIWTLEGQLGPESLLPGTMNPVSALRTLWC